MTMPNDTPSGLSEGERRGPETPKCAVCGRPKSEHDGLRCPFGDTLYNQHVATAPEEAAVPTTTEIASLNSWEPGGFREDASSLANRVEEWAARVATPDQYMLTRAFWTEVVAALRAASPAVAVPGEPKPIPASDVLKELSRIHGEWTLALHERDQARADARVATAQWHGWLAKHDEVEAALTTAARQRDALREALTRAERAIAKEAKAAMIRGRQGRAHASGLEAALDILRAALSRPTGAADA